MSTPKIDNDNIQTVADLLTRAESVLFITGAGLSADSGLPTYRGIGGLYNHKTTDHGVPIETALSGQMMADHPEITWQYLAQIEHACRTAKHNRGHEVIAEIEAHPTFNRVWTLTQNIDGFHHAAGSQNVIDIHGDAHDLACTQCPYRTTVRDYSQLDIPPACPKCHAVVRPQVVLFGEMLAPEKCQTLAEQLQQGFGIVFSIGTTSVFPYIAQPVLDAKRRGKTAIEINPAQTHVSDLVDIKLPTPAAETLHAIWAQFQSSIVNRQS